MAWLRDITDRDDAVQEAARAADITGLLSTRIDKLSGGQRRRVGIASSLMGLPPVLLLDELTAGLDVAQRDHLSVILEQIRATTCVILSTHIVEDLVGVADTITVLDGGRFAYSGPLAEFTSDATTEGIRRRYLSLLGEEVA